MLECINFQLMSVIENMSVLEHSIKDLTEIRNYAWKASGTQNGQGQSSAAQSKVYMYVLHSALLTVRPS